LGDREEVTERVGGAELRSRPDGGRVSHPEAAALDPQRRSRSVDRLQRLAYWLDDRFVIPGTRWRVGLDGLVGLLPGVGDTATAALSLYIIFEALRLGVPRPVVQRMLINIGIDYAAGLVPLAGDLFDVGWKANRRNIRLVLRHLEASQR
jgi:hypothetical protein